MSMITLAGMHNFGRLGKRYHQGFSLMEVLIAIVILGVGLLGIAGLQAVSIRNTHSAYLRTQATFLAYNIIDSIRANPDAVASYAVAWDAAPATHQACEAVACTTAQLATHDLNIWKCSLGKWDGNTICSTNLNITGLLPGGDGEVVVAGNNVTVSVRWVDLEDKDDDGEPDPTTLAIATQI